MSAGTNYVSMSEFVELGYLQELNRQFLHPLGMALSFLQDAGGNYRFAGIIDHRGDPEGVIFASNQVESEEFRAKAQRVFSSLVRRAEARENGLGYVVQPVDGLPELIMRDIELDGAMPGEAGEREVIA